MTLAAARYRNLVFLFLSVIGLLTSVNAQSIEGCQTYGPQTPTGKSSCIQCFSGFFISADLLSCQACTKGCINCTQQQACTSCQAGMYLTPQLTCEACTQYCEKCQADGTCSSCTPGYYLVSKVCVRCHANCKECNIYSNCVSCNDGFELVDNECKIKDSSSSWGLILTIVGIVVLVIVLIICDLLVFGRSSGGLTSLLCECLCLCCMLNN